MPNRASNNIKNLLVSGDIDFTSDTLKIILMASGYAFNPDTHDEYADVSASELPTGSGYTAGDKTLANVTVTRDDVDDRIEITCDNPSWVASGGSIGPTPGAIIYDETATGDPIVGYIDFLTEFTQLDGGTITIANIEIRVA
jgi:hypothetical protein